MGLGVAEDGDFSLVDGGEVNEKHVEAAVVSCQFVVVCSLRLCVDRWCGGVGGAMVVSECQCLRVLWI